MRYTEYKRRNIKAGLYIITTKDKDTIYAISDNIEYCHKYIETFRDTWFYPNKINPIVEPILDSSEACKLYIMLGDTLFLEEYKQGFVFTSIEIKYYNELLMKMYSDMKTMMCQMLLNDRILSFESDEKEANRVVFDMYYEKCKSFNGFVDSIDPHLFVQEYILTPIAVTENLNMDDMYKDAVYKSK